MRIERVIADDTLILNSETGQELLRLRESTDGTAACAAVSGRLINEIVHDVEDELVALSLASEKVIIDLNEAGYISNAMIRSFLELQHLMDAKNGELILKGLSDDVFRVFEDMGVEDVFMIERSGQ